MLDIENTNESVKNLKDKFLRLHNRFIAVAMDYKYYIDSNISDNEIYKLRDNVTFRLESAKFHFELLLQHNYYIEHNVKEIHKSQHAVLNGGIELQMYQIQATKEIYSLFDSLVYHLCSNFDYLFRLINFIHGNTELTQPKWNLFRTDKNIKSNIYCSKELIEALTILDDKFVYPDSADLQSVPTKCIKIQYCYLYQTKKPVNRQAFQKKGGDILSHITAVPSAQSGLTSLFGMGRGEPRRNNHLKRLNCFEQFF